MRPREVDQLYLAGLAEVSETDEVSSSLNLERQIEGPLVEKSRGGEGGQ